jgi:hypothetical protein
VRTGRNRQWSANSVQWVRWRYAIHRANMPPPSVRRPNRRSDGLYSIHGVAARFKVTENIVRYWIEKGWLKSAEGGGLGRTFWFELDRATIKRLETAKANGYGSRRQKHSQTHRKEKQYA